MRSDLVLKGSVLSEKAYGLSATGTYTLKVDLKATKADVRKALKDVFGVDAISVNTLITRGKVRRKARSKKSAPVFVKSANTKKAFVKLKQGQSLPTPALDAGAATLRKQPTAS
jgi:large subunit ribosomal protein L23